MTLPLIAVEDTLIAYGLIARAHRRRMGASVVAVGGSNGKTTTKEMIAAILERVGPTLRTRANHNNRVGVPQTLLRLRPEHRFAVIEMGTNEPGEMAPLTHYTCPDVGLLTNVQPEHLEGLGDLQGVLDEEAQLYAQMPPDGVRVINLDDPSLASYARLDAPHVTFGRHPEADVRLVEAQPLGQRGQRVALSLRGRTLSLTLPLLGAHNALNAAAAAACTEALGVDVETLHGALEALQPVAQRMVPMQIAGRLVINDAYNANPGSMRAALEALPSILPDRRWVAVLGEMREMGDQAEALHEALGELAVRAPLKALYVFGAGAAATATAARRCAPDLPLALGDSPHEAAAFVARHATRGEGVLIKGSRGVRLERVIDQLPEACAAT